MLCDTCTKATVCRLKEDCNRLERSISGNKIEDILSLEIRCKEYQGKTQGIKSPVRFPDLCEANNDSAIATAQSPKRWAYDKNSSGYVEIRPDGSY